MSNKKPQLTPESDITKMCVEIKLFVNGRELGTLDMYKPWEFSQLDCRPRLSSEAEIQRSMCEDDDLCEDNEVPF